MARTILQLDFVVNWLIFVAHTEYMHHLLRGLTLNSVDAVSPMSVGKNPTVVHRRTDLRSYYMSPVNYSNLLPRRCMNVRPSLQAQAGNTSQVSQSNSKSASSLTSAREMVITMEFSHIRDRFRASSA